MRPARAIQGHLHQGFIEGRYKVTEAMNAFSISQGLAEGLSHRNADVFVGVVIIYVGITHRSNREID
jgi:hypothetical protein